MWSKSEKLNNKKGFRSGGFTLAEAMMAIVVLTIAAAGLIVPFSSGAAVQAEGMHQTLSARLGCDLLEQILSTDFDQIVSSYDGYAETQGHIKNAAGTELTDPIYSKFSRQVTCEYVHASQQSQIAGTEFILVNVKVFYDGVKKADVDRLISR